MAADPIQQLTETRAEEVTLRAIATDWFTPGHTPLAMTHAILAALADAGLLVPANSTAVEEWAYPAGPDDNLRMIATWLRDPVIPGMAKRAVITTPWVEVPRPTIGGVE